MKTGIWSFTVTTNKGTFTGKFFANEAEIKKILKRKILLSNDVPVTIIIPHKVKESDFVLEQETDENFCFVNRGFNPLKAIDITDIVEPEITSKKHNGDDSHSHAVFLDGRLFIDGITKGEVKYYKELAYSRYIFKQIKYMQ